MKHKHHIIPKHMGGTNEKSNLTPPISVELHAALHKDLFEHFGKTEDFIAWKVLSGQSLAGIEISDAVRKKMSLRQMGTKNSFFGKKHSKETKAKISKSSSTFIRTPESNLKRMATQSELHTVQLPTGEIKVIKGLRKFCRDHNLVRPNLIQTKYSKGYRLLEG